MEFLAGYLSVGIIVSIILAIRYRNDRVYSLDLVSFIILVVCWPLVLISMLIVWLVDET